MDGPELIEETSRTKKQGFLRPEVAGIEEQQILAVAKLRLGDPAVVAMWYGESDLPTDPSICDAAAQSLRQGETFYSHKQGIPELRHEIATYLGNIHGARLDSDRISVTASGMSAITMLMQSIVDPGANVVAVCPVWPNAAAVVRMCGATPRFCPLDQMPGGGWQLSIDRLRSLCDDRTRAIFVNSPNNPTGWTLSTPEILALRDFARQTGIWILADEVFDRLVYDASAAPSFLPHIDADDPVVVINSLSKSWGMTGWRIGWMVHPYYLNDILGNVIEFNYSCVPEFVQRGAVEAFRAGEPLVRKMVDHCEQGRQTVNKAMRDMPLVDDFHPADATFYAFFKVQGAEGRTLNVARHLLMGYDIGVAPGSAFGPRSDGYIRLCFALAPQTVAEGMSRLRAGLTALASSGLP